MNEVKTFTIVDTETQRTREIKSDATTVAELKRDLRQNGFNVDGKSIQEALTRTEFKDDSSLLPHDVSYKGRTTNDLVFRLTKSDKHVKSGMNRQEAYAKIREKNLGDAVKAKFGKNFTQCSTADLVEFLDGLRASKKCKCEKSKKAAKKETPKEEVCKCEIYIRNLVNILIENGTLEEEDNETIFSCQAVAKSKYSEDELNELLSGL